AVSRIRKHLPALLAEVPALRVVSVNLQQAHAAVLEGDEEIPLTPDESLPMRVNCLTLHLRARSFFQTNTRLAETMYRQAREWVDETGPSSLWDLYCGVGGFALHGADGKRPALGIEIAEEAIASAIRSRDEMGIANLEFIAGDATEFERSVERQPELVIVNPPRRGIGAELARAL